MTCSLSKRTTRIRKLNDSFRRTFSGGKVMLGRSVVKLDSVSRANLYDVVHYFDAFTPNIDHDSEHDFGDLEFAGQRFCFKIDYYDSSFEFFSDDPANPHKTTRVLTIW